MQEDTPYEVVRGDTTPAQRAAAWAIGSGLQAVDGLRTSKMANEVAQQYIAGKIGYEVFEQEIRAYYDDAATPNDNDSREADVAAARITRIINEPGFVFSPGALAAIHQQIFEDILPKGWVGKWRTENITKKEPVLNNKTVTYSSAAMIKATLDYDFSQEAARGLPPNATDAQCVSQAVAFASSIWQIHPFREGNTRAVAVFLIKYLREMGLVVDNRPFAENAQYFRDALVLDNAPLRQRNAEPLAQFAKLLLGQPIQLPSLRSSAPQ